MLLVFVRGCQKWKASGHSTEGKFVYIYQQWKAGIHCLKSNFRIPASILAPNTIRLSSVFIPLLMTSLLFIFILFYLWCYIIFVFAELPVSCNSDISDYCYRAKEGIKWQLKCHSKACFKYTEKKEKQQLDILTEHCWDKKMHGKGNKTSRK